MGLVFIAGLALFSAASLANALANTGEVLIIARGVQGLGAALISPAALSILTTTFAEGEERTKAMGVWGAIAGAGGAFGLLIGGILTDLLSWPWIFLVNIPIGIGTAFAALRLVPESRGQMAHRRFDLAGAVSVTAGLLVLVYAIVRAEVKGWGSLHTLGLSAVAVALLVAFVLIERRSVAPLVRLSLLRIRTLASANGVMFIVIGGLFGMFFFASLYVQQILGYSPLEAGLAFLPFQLVLVSPLLVPVWALGWWRLARDPDGRLMRLGHRLYFRKVVPAIGALLSDREAYSYLPRSTAYLPAPGELLATLRASGFPDARRLSLSGGVTQLIVATRG